MRRPLDTAFAAKPLAALPPPPTEPRADEPAPADGAAPPADLPPTTWHEPAAEPAPGASDLPAEQPDAPQPAAGASDPDPPDPSVEELLALLTAEASEQALREVPAGWQASLPAADEPPELPLPPAAEKVALPDPDEPPPPAPKVLLTTALGGFTLLAAVLLAAVWYLGSPDRSPTQVPEPEPPAAWVKWGALLGRADATGLAFGREGALSAGCSDGSLHLWLDYRGQPLTWPGHPDAGAACLAFGPSGAVLATGAGAGSATESAEVRLWWPATGRPLRSWHAHQGGVGCVAFSPDGRRVATGGGDQAVRLWETATGLELLTLHGHANPVVALAFSPDGNRLVTAGGWDQTARVWDLAQRRELFTLRGHKGYVSAAAFSPDGKRIATGEGDRDEWGRVRLWDAATGAELTAPPEPPHGRVTCLAFSPDGKWLACGSRDGTARVWRHDGAPAGTLGHGARVDALAFRRDGQLLATAAADGVVRLWRKRDGPLPEQPAPPGPAPAVRIQGGPEELAAGDTLTLNLSARAAAPALTEYRLNDGPWQSAWPAGQVMLANLGPGPLAVEARAVGPRGELSPPERRAWTVLPRNRPPVLVRVDLDGEEVYAGDRVWLRARALCSDPDGDRVTCRWRLPAGGAWNELPADGWFEVDGLREGEAEIEFQAADDRKGLSEPVSRFVTVTANPKARALTRGRERLRWSADGRSGRLELPPLLLSYDFDLRVQVRPGDFGSLSVLLHGARGGRDLEVRLEDEGNKVAVKVAGRTVQRLDLSGKNALWLGWGRKGGVHRLSLGGKEVAVNLPPQHYNGRVTLTTPAPALTELWGLEFTSDRGR